MKLLYILEFRGCMPIKSATPRKRQRDDTPDYLGDGTINSPLNVEKLCNRVRVRPPHIILTKAVGHLNTGVEPKAAGGGKLVRGVSHQENTSLGIVPCSCGITAEKLQVFVGDKSVHCPRSNGADLDVQGFRSWPDGVLNDREASLTGEPLRVGTVGR